MTENRRATVSTWDGSFNFSLKKASAIVALLISFTSLLGGVYAAARAGVASAVKEEINLQIETEHSPMNRQIHAVIDAHERDICEPRWEEVRARMTEIEIGTARVETKIDILLERAE